MWWRVSEKRGRVPVSGVLIAMLTLACLALSALIALAPPGPGSRYAGSSVDPDHVPSGNELIDAAVTATDCRTGGALIVLGPTVPTPSFCTPEFKIPRPERLRAPERSIVVVRVPGHTFGTKNSGDPIPGLSLIKLIMADWVLSNRDPDSDEIARLKRMIVDSNDESADKIWEKYGEKMITEQVRKYHLQDTKPEDHRWGYTESSLPDLALFVSTLRAENPGSPVLWWMRSPARKAADGTVQYWGTGTLPGVYGSKYGWDNDGSVVASLSYGPGFVVASFTIGDADDQTEDVHEAMARVPYFQRQYARRTQEDIITVEALAPGE